MPPGTPQVKAYVTGATEVAGVTTRVYCDDSASGVLVHGRCADTSLRGFTPKRLFQRSMNTRKYAFASYLIRLAADNARIVAKFLNRWMNTQTFQNAVKGFASRAIGQANISASNLAMCEIPLPPLDIQREIVAEIEAERALLEANRRLVELFKKKTQTKLNEIWDGGS